MSAASREGNMSWLRLFSVLVFQIIKTKTNGGKQSGLRACVETCQRFQSHESLPLRDLACCFSNSNDFSAIHLKEQFYQAIISHCKCSHVQQERKTFKQNFCPSDQVQHNMSCYYFNNAPVTWTTAVSVCQKLGARLVKVEDKTEDAFIVSQLKLLPLEDGLDGYWTDGQCADNMCHWSDGTPVLYTRWGPTEPDNQGHSNYIAYIHPERWYSNFQWGSHHIWLEVTKFHGCGVICEIPGSQFAK